MTYFNNGGPFSSLAGWRERLAFSMVLAVFLTWGFGQDGAWAAMSVLTLLLVAQWREVWPWLQDDPLFLVVASLLLFFVARTGVEAWEQGYSLSSTLRVLGPWLLAAGALPMLVFSLWLARFPGYVRHLFWLYPAAILLWSLDKTNWDHFYRVLQGSGRLELGHGNPNSMGFFLAIALLGFWFFRWRWVGGDGVPLALRWLRGLAWVVATLGTLYLLLLTGSRSSWLGLLLVTALYVAFNFRWGGIKRGSSLAWLVLLAVTFGGGSGIFQERVENRLQGPSALVQAWWAGEELPNNSGAKRLWMWEYGLEKWSERPWIGWGARAGGELMREHPKPFLRHFRDYHNIEVSLLTRFGVVGTVLFASLFFLVFRELYRAYRRDIVTCSEYWFHLSTLIFFLGRSQFSNKILEYPFVLTLTIVGGAAYMGRWRRRCKGGANASVCR